MTSNETKSATGLINIELEGDTLIVTPTADLSELAFHEIEAAAKQALQRMLRSQARNVVVDLHRMNYSGSTALGFFLRLWKVVIGRGGAMAFCNVSEDEQDILRVTNLDRWWTFCSSRDEALALVRGGSSPI